jgi:hypothetical protein
MGNKKFDSVELKRKGASHVYEKVSKMTRTEELSFWKKGNQELRKIIDSLKPEERKAS